MSFIYSLHLQKDLFFTSKLFFSKISHNKYEKNIKIRSASYSNFSHKIIFPRILWLPILKKKKQLHVHIYYTSYIPSIIDNQEPRLDFETNRFIQPIHQIHAINLVTHAIRRIHHRIKTYFSQPTTFPSKSSLQQRLEINVSSTINPKNPSPFPPPQIPPFLPTALTTRRGQRRRGLHTWNTRMVEVEVGGSSAVSTVWRRTLRATRQVWRGATAQHMESVRR